MRIITLSLGMVWVLHISAAELESRVLTHYIPQDFLETAIRTEAWTEVPINLKGGVREGDVIRIWAGGSIDRGNGDQPSQYVAGPAGESARPSAAGEGEAPAEPRTKDKRLGRSLALPADASKAALSFQPEHAYALLFKTDNSGIKKCAVPGKPLEITVTRDKEKLFVGFNDDKGRFYDNHLGRGRRHELDPLWVRIEIVRTIVD